MITSAQLATLYTVDPNASLPGIDTQTGNLTPAVMMIQLGQLFLSNTKPYYYDPSRNLVYVKKDGVVLDGINFGSAEVVIYANNVTIKNCTFTNTSGWDASINQEHGYAGAVVENCTFTNTAQTNLLIGCYVNGYQYMTVQNNTFIDTPGDGVHIESGVVSGNYFVGCGYEVGTHPDAIYVPMTNGPVSITGNFIDWTPNSTQVQPSNDCIRIVAYLGDTSNVTVSGNYLIGGSSVVDAGNVGPYTFSNINISNNYIGFGAFYNFYAGPQNGVTATNNVIIDYTNPIFSTSAWNAYLAAGIQTNSLVTASPGATTITASTSGTTTLYAGGASYVHLNGGASETIFAGGSGVQYMWGGSGENVFSYLTIGDSTVAASDLIGNFHASTDVIDLHAINADPSSYQPVNFSFIGSAAFSGAGDEVRVVQDVANNRTLVDATMAGDSTPDLEIRLSGLLNLTAANFALTASQYNADIAANTTVAWFETNQPSLDQVAGGFSIGDTVANVQSDLTGLQADAANIDAITATGGVFTVNTATFASDQAVLDKITGGFAVVDTSVNVLAQISTLENDASHISSVTLSDSTAASPAVLSLTSAAATGDAAILKDIVSPYVLDTAVNGATTVVGHGNGIMINLAAGDSMVTGGGTSETFAFSSKFGPIQIADFAPSANNATTHDTISLSTTDFGNWATLLSDGHSSGVNNADTTFTAADGASLTLVGMSLSSLQHAGVTLKADFTFHA